MSHLNLSDYYQIMFMMAQHHKYQIRDLEALIPFERDIYVGMVADLIQKQKQNNEHA